MPGSTDPGMRGEEIAEATSPAEVRFLPFAHMGRWRTETHGGGDDPPFMAGSTPARPMQQGVAHGRAGAW